MDDVDEEEAARAKAAAVAAGDGAASATLLALIAPGIRCIALSCFRCGVPRTHEGRCACAYELGVSAQVRVASHCVGGELPAFSDTRLGLGGPAGP